MLDSLLLMGQIATLWLALGALFGGVGFLALRGLRRGTQADGEEAWLCFWAGWALTLAYLQGWHLFRRVDGWALLPLVLLGSAGLLLLLREKRGTLRLPGWVGWLFGALGLGVMLWLANQALGPTPIYDTGLYHAQAVRWAAEYPIVPGLGNLHGRLAFNSSFFLYAALLDGVPWQHRAHLLANGLLLAVALLQALHALYRLLTSAAPPRLDRLFQGLMLAPLLSQAIFVSSLAPDLSIFVLGFLITTQLARFLAPPAMEPAESRLRLVIIALLAAASMTVKLNGALLALPTLAIVGALGAARLPNRARLLGIGLLVGALFLLPWALRGLLTSGYPAYPSTIGGVAMPWQVPRPLVLSEANWIQSWGRQPNRFWSEVLADGAWLQPWLASLPPYLTTPLKLALGAGALALIVQRVAPAGLRRGWLLVAPPLLALMGWFVAAPNPRFAAPAPWLLATGLLALAALPLHRAHPRERALAGLLCLLLLPFVELPRPLLVSPPPTGSFHPLPQPATLSAPTADGSVTVQVPQQGDQCWDSPLPCTPYFRPELRLREAGNLGAGFTLSDDKTFVDIHGSEVPAGFVVAPELGLSVQPGGWHPYEAAGNSLWMASPGTLLLYSRTATPATLALTPITMFVGDGLGGAGTLRVALNGHPLGEWPVASGQRTEIALPLRRDFNRVTLELAAGNFVPHDLFANNLDRRTLSIAFQPIEIRPDPAGR